MKALIRLALAGMLSAAPARAQWYNGDPDLQNFLAAEVNTSVSDAFVFENFDWWGGWFSPVFGNYLMDFTAVGYRYELRVGMTNGSGGTLIASGDTDGCWLQWPNGFDAFGFTGYTLYADIPWIRLPAGQYMIALSPKGTGSGRSFVQSTSGAGSLGTPINDYRNWFTSGYFGANYWENYLGVPGFSYGTMFWYPECPQDLNWDGRVDTLDVIMFLNLWAAGDCRADWNWSDTVDSQDVLEFLGAWAAGC